MHAHIPSLIPAFFSRLALLFCGTWAALLMARCVMLWLVWPEVRGLPWADTLYALYLGSKFDARIAVFLCLPLALVLSVPWLERRLPVLRRWLMALYALSMLGVGLVYAVDFGFFFYLRQRVDATLFELARDFSLSLSMVWQSYPVIWITLALATFTLLCTWWVAWVLGRHARAPRCTVRWHAAWAGLTLVLGFLLAYGQVSSNLFPLRWSNAYFSPNRYLVILGLNPVQNLRDSYVALHSSQPDVGAVREAYARMAPWLGVNQPDPAKLNYWRITPAAQPSVHPPLNVVVLIMESLGTPRTSLASGLFTPGGEVPTQTDADDPTPNLRKLAGQSLYVPWFFAPTRTTARAVFTTVTGIPDVNRSSGTSSRNPALVDQFSILGEFQGYDLSYMLGGSANWANIRGVLTHNVAKLRLLEEGDWTSPNVDVWGISDLALFQEAVSYLNTRPQPFISIIQTAGFHRPWTIPADNAGFKARQVSPEVLHHYGFEQVEEYNSMRFADHALGEFFRLARTQPWYNNTVFAIMGDHGLNEPSANVPEGYLACRLQSNHIPLLLYAPGRPDLFTPGVLNIPAGQPDLLPTLATLAGIPFRNHSLGRNLLDPAHQLTAHQFLGGDAEAFVRLLENGYCYFNEQQEALYLINGNGENLLESEPERATRLRTLAQDALHTSKYLLFNNQKGKAPDFPAQ